MPTKGFSGDLTVHCSVSALQCQSSNAVSEDEGTHCTGCIESWVMKWKEGMYMRSLKSWKAFTWTMKLVFDDKTKVIFPSTIFLSKFKRLDRRHFFLKISLECLRNKNAAKQTAWAKHPAQLRLAETLWEWPYACTHGTACTHGLICTHGTVGTHGTACAHVIICTHGTVGTNIMKITVCARSTPVSC